MANSSTRFVVILGRGLHTESLKGSSLGQFHLQACSTKEGITCLSFPAGKMVVAELTSCQASG